MKLTFGEFVVTALVVSLFFERIDYILYLEHGFAIPDVAFVVAGILVLVYASVLAYRRTLDLSHPSWAELTIVALFVVLGLTSLGAALFAHTSTGRSASTRPAVIRPSDRPYQVTARHAHVQQKRMSSGGWAVHVTPVDGRSSALGLRVGGRPIRIDPRLAYSYSVRLKTTSAPVGLSVVLRQLSPGTTVKPVDTTRHLEVGPHHWVRIVVTTEPAHGARVLKPLIVLPRLRRKTTLLLVSARLTTQVRVPFAIPAAPGASYNVHPQGGAKVSEYPSGLSDVWTVVAKSRPGRPGAVRFVPRVRTPPSSHDLAYVFTTRLHSAARATPVTVGLLRLPTSAGAAQVAATQPVIFKSAGWAEVKLSAEAPPGTLLEPFVSFPRSSRPRTLVIWNARLTAQPPVALTRHFGQSVKTFVHFAYFGLIALLLGRILTPALMRRALGTFFVLAVAASVLAVLQAIDQNALHTGASEALHLVSRSRSQSGSSGFLSPCSIFSEPAFLGYFSLLGILIGLRMHGSWPTRWVWVGIGFCLVAILLAAAAGPIVALVAVALYLAWRASRVWRRFWKELTALVVIGIAVLAFLPAGKALTTRADSIISGSDASAKFRYAFDSASIKTWKLSPLTGVGLGNTRYYLPSLVDLSFDPNLTASDAQFQSVSSYLNTLAESGVFGLLMLVTMLATLFWPFGRRRSEDDWLTEAAILLLIVASFFITVVADPIFWFWVGLRLADLRGVETETVDATVSESVSERDLQPTPTH